MVNYHGNWWGDDIDGSSSADQLFGEGGDDDISGKGGNDFLQGGEGNDVISGGSGNDVLVSGKRDPHLDSGALLGFDIDEGGNDVLDGGSGNDRLIVTMDSRTVDVDGGSENDTLQMGSDNDDFTDFIGDNVFVTDPDLFTARIDLEAGTGRYRFNGTLVSVDITVANVENIEGTAMFETFSGTDEVNILNGEGGNDILRGRGGADILNGGGVRFLDNPEDGGNDTATYDDSAVAVDVDLLRTTQIGGDAQGDRLISIENLNGSSSSDRLRGTDSVNILNGNGGSDIIEGRGGADTINGGTGSDTASYESSQQRVVVDLRRTGTQSGGDAEGDRLTSIENLTGSMWDDVLTGTDSTNVLSGGFSTDVLFGLGGNDTLEGGGGNDILDGGNGVDIATYVNAFSGVQVILGQNGADGRVTGQYPVNDVDTLRSIEGVFGSNFDDAMFGNEQSNLFRGNGGNDYFLESRGNDDYIGDAGIDTLDFNGNPTAVAVSIVNGTVTHIGSNETDTIFSVERIVGSNGDDGIVGSSAAEFLFGSGGRDILVGAGGIDLLDGGSGDDSLDGGLGNDTLVGGTGLDTADFGAWDTPPPGGGVIFFTSQVTVRLGSNGADGIATRSQFGNVIETDTLRGIESVVGSNNSDTLIGNELDNNLSGEEGNDILIGGGQIDVDRLVGGGGSDTFLYQSRDDSRTTAGATGDAILDFKIGEDKIDLRALNVNAAIMIFEIAVIDDVNFTRVTEDLNGNGTVDLGEFSVNVRIDGGGFVSLQDVLV